MSIHPAARWIPRLDQRIVPGPRPCCLVATKDETVQSEATTAKFLSDRISHARATRTVESNGPARCRPDDARTKPPRHDGGGGPRPCGVDVHGTAGDPITGTAVSSGIACLRVRGSPRHCVERPAPLVKSWRLNKATLSNGCCSSTCGGLPSNARCNPRRANARRETLTGAVRPPSGSRRG